jgi:Uma2 family endonuclease
MVTSVPALREQWLPIAEFKRLFDHEGPFELIDGERVTKMPNIYGHSQTVHQLYDALNPVVRAGKLGHVYIETTFAMSDDPQWVKGSRIPDLMFIRQERLDAYRAAHPHYRELPLVLVPDIAVEVVSPTDSYTEVHAKVSRYLADGVLMVWVLDPEIRMVLVERQGSTRKLLDGDVLTGDEIIPGFQITLHDLFHDDTEESSHDE